MKPIKKAVATCGTYTNHQGEEKNRYLTVGKLFQRDDGSVCLMLDSVPTSPEWNGWINFYDLEENRQRQNENGMMQARAAAAAAEDEPRDQFEDDIPF